MPLVRNETPRQLQSNVQIHNLLEKSLKFMEPVDQGIAKLQQNLQIPTFSEFQALTLSTISQEIAKKTITVSEVEVRTLSAGSEFKTDIPTFSEFRNKHSQKLSAKEECIIIINGNMPNSFESQSNQLQNDADNIHEAQLIISEGNHPRASAQSESFQIINPPDNQQQRIQSDYYQDQNSGKCYESGINSDNYSQISDTSSYLDQIDMEERQREKLARAENESRLLKLLVSSRCKSDNAAVYDSSHGQSFVTVEKRKTCDIKSKQPFENENVKIPKEQTKKPKVEHDKSNAKILIPAVRNDISILDLWFSAPPKRVNLDSFVSELSVSEDKIISSDFGGLEATNSKLHSNVISESQLSHQLLENEDFVTNAMATKTEISFLKTTSSENIYDTIKPLPLKRRKRFVEPIAQPLIIMFSDEDSDNSDFEKPAPRKLSHPALEKIQVQPSTDEKLRNLQAEISKLAEMIAIREKAQANVGNGS